MVQLKASFVYANEMVDSSARLVVTPLTVRARITITQALAVGVGAAAMGPAGRDTLVPQRSKTMEVPGRGKAESERDGELFTNRKLERRTWK